METKFYKKEVIVLNLIITGIPSIRLKMKVTKRDTKRVLNLIITGIPSILYLAVKEDKEILVSFKPYYNWNTFNTLDFARVLNSWLFSSFFNPRNI